MGNPVQMGKLVEIISTKGTDSSVTATCEKFVQDIGKVGVNCADTPGFIVNRLLVPYLAQAMVMLENGVATKEDIDTGMKLGAGHPMGPITLADYVGLDTCLFILQGWVKNFPDEPSFFVPKILEEKVQKGELGRKSGQGFYTWQNDKPV